MLIKSLILLVGFVLTLFSNDFYYAYGKKIQLAKLYESRAINDSSTIYYLTPEGEKVGIKDEILVACKDTVNCKKELKKYDFSKISQLTKTLLVIKIQKNDNIFTLLQELHNDTNIMFAHPNFVKTLRKR